VTAGYGGRPALRGVSVELRRGEVVALMGRNGAGKSTLLRVTAGLHRPSAGSVSVRGTAPDPGRNVALCPQTPENVLFRDSVADEVETTLRASGRRRPAEDVLGDLGIADIAQRHPRDLSAGQRLLVAIAAIAATEAPILLLDEPTRGLDPESKACLSGFLTTWASRGDGAMVATHDVELAATIASRVVILAQGEVIADGEPGDILGDSPVFAPQMTRVFGPGWLTPDQVIEAVTTV
jgi:energy-coupling factor transport system ATP-binding protein